MSETAREWRCDCHRQLMRVRRVPGTHIEVKCEKCGKVNVLDIPDRPADLT